jgi:hypothetical protein
VCLPDSLLTCTYREKVQGCQVVCFQTKNPDLGKFWRALDWKMFINFMATWNILWRFGIFYDHLVHFVFIWYIFPVLVSCAKKNLATLEKTDCILKKILKRTLKNKNKAKIPFTQERFLNVSRGQGDQIELIFAFWGDCLI